MKIPPTNFLKLDGTTLVPINPGWTINADDIWVRGGTFIEPRIAGDDVGTSGSFLQENLAATDNASGFQSVMIVDTSNKLLYGGWFEAHGKAGETGGTTVGVIAIADPKSTTDTANGLSASIGSGSAIGDPTVDQISIHTSNAVAGTDTNMKKWAFYNATSTSGAYLGGKVFLGGDDHKTYWGTGFDASIHYDGTDLIINPQEVGAGLLSVGGDMSVGGSITGANVTSGVDPGHTHTAASITTYWSRAGTTLSTQTAGDDVDIGGELDVVGHSAFGATGSVLSNYVLNVDETTTILTGTRSGTHVDFEHSPSAPLSGTTNVTGSWPQAKWNSAEDGSVFAYIFGTKSEAIGTGTGAINTLIGSYAIGRHQGFDTVTKVEGARGHIINDDVATEAGHITVASSLAASGYTDKSGGVISTRYGLEIEDVTGGGLLTDQYGIYCPALTGASGDNFFIKNVSAPSDFGSGDIDTTGTITVGTGFVLSGSTSMVSVSTGAADNDKMVTQGYVDDAIGVAGYWDRTGTLLTPKTSGDDVAIDGVMSVGVATAGATQLYVAGVGATPAGNGGSDQGLMLTNATTDLTNKRAKIKCQHETNAEEPVTMIQAFCASSDNHMMLGGGLSNENAMEYIDFYSAPNDTTLTGTNHFRILYQQLYSYYPLAWVVNNVALTAGNYEIGRNVATNLQYNVPTGKEHSFTVNDVESLSISSSLISATSVILAKDKIAFTQVDQNEYIDSLADGYLDLGATTEVRINGPAARVLGDLYIGNDAHTDPAIVMTGDHNDGQITYMEDEDEFLMSSRVRVPSVWHSYGGFEDQAETITCGAGDWNLITNAGNNLWNLDEADGVTEAADVFTLTYTGDYAGVLSMSVAALNNKDFHVRVYNNTQARVEGRPIGFSTLGAGQEANVCLPIYIEGTAGDTIQFEISSADGTDPDVDDAIFWFSYLHD